MSDLGNINAYAQDTGTCKMGCTVLGTTVKEKDL